MALGFVLVGISAGLLAAGAALAFGGGIGLAILAYVGGGMGGVIGGMAIALLPRDHAATLVAEDHG